MIKVNNKDIKTLFIYLFLFAYENIRVYYIGILT